MRRWPLLIALVACSSHPPHGTGPGTGSSAAPDAAPVAAAPADAALPAALTDEECDQFIEHVLRLQLALRDDKDKITDDDIATAKAKLKEQMGSGCLAMDRATFECIMAAADIATVQTCAGGS